MTAEERAREFLNTHRVGNYQALVVLIREAEDQAYEKAARVSESFEVEHNLSIDPSWQVKAKCCPKEIAEAIRSLKREG